MHNGQMCNGTYGASYFLEAVALLDDCRGLLGEERIQASAQALRNFYIGGLLPILSSSGIDPNSLGREIALERGHSAARHSAIVNAARSNIFKQNNPDNPLTGAFCIGDFLLISRAHGFNLSLLCRPADTISAECVAGENKRPGNQGQGNFFLNFNLQKYPVTTHEWDWMLLPGTFATKEMESRRQRQIGDCIYSLIKSEIQVDTIKLNKEDASFSLKTRQRILNNQVTREFSTDGDSVEIKIRSTSGGTADSTDPIQYVLTQAAGKPIQVDSSLNSMRVVLQCADGTTEHHTLHRTSSSRSKITVRQSAPDGICTLLAEINPTLGEEELIHTIDL